MARRPAHPEDYPTFAALPVRQITVGRGGDSVAVHVRGTITADRMPLVALPGYHRNMADYTEFVPLFLRLIETDWPVVLVDFRGRGRSRDRKEGYTTIQDATDLTAVADALGIHRAVFLGQGYGGQVIMALGAQRATLIGGSILIDAGPVSDPRGLVRLRTNLRHLETQSGEGAGLEAMRTILRSDYPGLPDERLDQIAFATHFFDQRARLRPLFDPRLIDQLDAFEVDDILVSQWPLFHALAAAPMMLVRTQLNDLLRRETFETMARRRPDAVGFIVPAQGSPALLDGDDEVGSIADFVLHAQELGDKLFKTESA
jgi:pimeloyl-ACP methyl ester carboxylesterase